MKSFFKGLFCAGVVVFGTSCFTSPVPWGLNGSRSAKESKTFGLLPDSLILSQITALDLSAADSEKKAFVRVPPKNSVTQDAFAVDKYVIDLRLVPEQKTFQGVVEIFMTRKDPKATELALDMDRQLILDNLALDGQTGIPNLRADDGLSLFIPPATPASFKLTVQYHSRSPEGGLYFSQIGHHTVQAWTRGEPTEARKWLPSVDRPDAKAPVEQYITVPAPWKVLANGHLTKIDQTAGHQVTYHWTEKFPLAPYLISFVAGELERVDSGNKTLPIDFWVPPGDENQAKMGFALTPDMMNFYSEKLVGYPYEKYSIGIAYEFPGAMEHTTATTFGRSLNSPRDGFEPAIAAHELSHHWFGDLVTCKTWNDLWLNEGFASYFDVLYWEHHLGREKLLERMESYKKRYWAQEVASGNGSMGPIFNPQTPPDEKFNAISYNKGALVLHTLRYELGDDAFFKGLAHYLEKFKFGAADTEDLKTALEESSHTDLKTFFDQWIYGSGIPEFKYSWTWNETTHRVLLNIFQTQNAPSVARFQVHLDVYVEYEDGSHTSGFMQKIQTGPSDGVFSVSVPTKPLAVILDPFHNVLSVTNPQKTDDEWRYILIHGPTSLTRIEAVSNLDKKLTSDDIERILAQDPSDYVKAAALSKAALFDQKNDHSLVEKIAKPFLKSPADVLRIEAVKLFGTIKDKAMVPELLDLYKNDVYGYVSMQAAYSLALIGDPRAYDAFLADLYMSPRRDYNILTAVISGLGMLGDKRAGSHLIEYFENVGPARWMKAVAASSLAMLKERSAVAPIGNSLIVEQNQSMALAFIEALRGIGAQEAVIYLQKVVNNPRTEKIKEAAQKAIDDLRKIP